MRLFEDLSKTISEKGKEAVNKAKDLTDVIKLKTQLAGEKSKLNETFQMIGRQYYETYKGKEADEAFQSAFLSVEASKKRISALEAEICNMEGCRTCPECGAKLNQEDSFCGKCGTKMPEKPDASMEENSFVREKDLVKEAAKEPEAPCGQERPEESENLAEQNLSGDGNCKAVEEEAFEKEETEPSLDQKIETCQETVTQVLEECAAEADLEHQKQSKEE